MHDGRPVPDRRTLAYVSAPFATIAAIIAVEALLVVGGHLLTAQAFYALLVLVLVNAGPREPASLSTPATAALGALRALALVPLIRVVALALPMRNWNDSVALLAVALPVGLVALRLAPLVGLRLRLVFSPRASLADVYAVSAGVVLSFLAYAAGAPALWPEDAPGDRVGLGIAAAVVAASVEEIVFRGLIQGTLQRAAGRLGLVAACAAFAATYLGSGSTAFVLTFALAGVVFAHAVACTGRLGGVILGHMLLVVGAGGVWPVLLDEGTTGAIHEPQTTIALSVAIAITLALALGHPLARASRPR